MIAVLLACYSLCSCRTQHRQDVPSPTWHDVVTAYRIGYRCGVSGRGMRAATNIPAVERNPEAFQTGCSDGSQEIERRNKQLKSALAESARAESAYKKGYAFGVLGVWPPSGGNVVPSAPSERAAWWDGSDDGKKVFEARKEEPTSE